jgi:hypothetical protein
VGLPQCQERDLLPELRADFPCPIEKLAGRRAYVRLAPNTGSHTPANANPPIIGLCGVLSNYGAGSGQRVASAITSKNPSGNDHGRGAEVWLKPCVRRFAGNERRPRG